MKKRKDKFFILEIIFIGLMVYSIYNIYLWNNENNKTNNILDDVLENVIKDDDDSYQVDFSLLKEKNSDAVGFLKVNGTEINYPVVKTNDNEYYLSHSFDKTKNSAGWIFADYRNKFDGTDKNIVIYGHNRRDGSMFSSLKNILNKQWYENNDNKFITLIVENKTLTYEVFSAYQTEEEDYYLKTSFNNNEFSKFVNELKSRSIYNFQTEVSEENNILTLSTCANDNKYRVVLHAKNIN